MHQDPYMINDILAKESAFDLFKLNQPQPFDLVPNG
jgi:hypothetical protein